MDNLKHLQEFRQDNEEQIPASSLKESMSLIDMKNVLSIPLEDRYYLLSTIQRALHIYIGGYVEYCNNNDIDELRDKVINSKD
jgi:hypothetical protein